jgi:replicative superfamily II helicase
MSVKATSLRESVLVFCPSRKGCEVTATLLSQLLRRGHDASESLGPRERLLRELHRVDASTVGVVDTMVQRGVCYHHAGLTIEARELLESAYKAGTLLVLAATSTLAVGVNLPAQRVIIHDVRVGTQPVRSVSSRLCVVLLRLWSRSWWLWLWVASDPSCCAWCARCPSWTS